MATLRSLLITLFVFLIICCTAPLSAIGSDGAQFSAGLVFGYNGGPGYQLSGLLSDFAPSFPLQVRLAYGQSGVAAGDAEDARRIFINDATNGTSQKAAQQSSYSVDFMYPMEVLSLKRTFLVFGPRYASYAANFKYVGGNEDFDVTSKQWGVGLGLTTYFPISSRADLVISGGFDHYLDNSLDGHDTSYSPDGENVNPRNDYDYGVADEAIDQPKQRAQLMFGVSYGLR